MELTREAEVLRAGRSGGPARPTTSPWWAAARCALSVRELELLAALAAAPGPRRPARGALRDGLGRAAARRRPLGRRVRPQAAGEAGARAAGVPLHPHALRLRLPASSRSIHTLFTRDAARTDNEDGTADEEARDLCWRSPSSGALAFGVVACGGDDEEPASGGARDVVRRRRRAVAARSRSTARRPSAPFAEAAAELFNEENPDVQITVGTSGTGGGFEKFCAGETDISTRRARSRTRRRSRSARRAASSTPRSRSPTTASPSRRTRSSPSTA